MNSHNQVADQQNLQANWDRRISEPEALIEEPLKATMDNSISITKVGDKNAEYGLPEDIRYPMKAIEIKGKESLMVKGLIDTGACATLINQEIAAKIGFLVHPHRLKFSTAAGSAVECEAVMPIKIYRENVPIIITAYVIPNLSNEIIIGENVIKFTQLIIRATAPKKPYD